MLYRNHRRQTHQSESKPGANGSEAYSGDCWRQVIIACDNASNRVVGTNGQDAGNDGQSEERTDGTVGIGTPGPGDDHVEG
ncbi:MAG TPA: hypothetical protein VHT75_18480 [Acidimicrobiales bacterium]|jgi:hypothetical protein|nr:hypothetical protein [Acidimicrobiales bacterium]